MLDSEAFPVVFFLLSFYAFAIMLLYALARAWQKALSNQANEERSPETASTGRHPAHRQATNSASDLAR